MFGNFFKKSKEKRNIRKKLSETEEKVHDAIEYFSAHKIPPTLDGIRQFTGLSIDEIESSNAFQTVSRK